MDTDFDCIVIGGGPAGSTVASFLRLMGRRVLLLERERFPRHHVGESMIAATIELLAELGLEEKLAAAGFPVKSGGCFIWGDSELPWCIRFDEVPGRPTSYQVKRDVFDALLLDHCAELGVDVRQEHKVRDVVRDDRGKVLGVVCQFPDGTRSEFRAPVTIDASGLNATIARRLSEQVPAEGLRNMALYGYWQGKHVAPATLGGELRTKDQNNIIIKWLGPGWLWFIPLGLDNLISVGYVAPRESIPAGGSGALESHLLDCVAMSPELTQLLSSCAYSGEFHVMRDWSYRSQRMAGPGYFAAGDAACFVDPILSSGVFLAVLYAKQCALAVNTCLDEPEMMPLVQEWYEALYDDSYRDYLQMAHFWYHGEQSTSNWMHEARTATKQDTQYAVNDRSSFLGLATGNTHAHPGYVHREVLDSLQFPAKLRKDPKLGQLRAMGNALLAHATNPDGSSANPDIHRSMQASAAHKARIARLMAQRPPIVDRLTDSTPQFDIDQSFVVHTDADISVEVVGEQVAVTVTAGGKRRVLDARETELLNRFGSAASPSNLARSRIATAERVYELCADLLAAGVLVPAKIQADAGRDGADRS